MKKLILALLAAAVASSAASAMSRSQIPTKFPIAWGASAGSSYIRTIPQTSQIGIQNCAASLTDGFPPLTFTPAAAGGCPPFGQDLNGILKQITQWSQWQGAGALVYYDSGFSASIGGYPEGTVLSQVAKPYCIWVSQVDDNTSNPDSAGSNWTGSCPGGGNGGTSTLSGGNPNLQIISASPYALLTNAKVCWIAGGTNTGALQINVNSGGLTNVYQRTPAGLAALSGGEVHSGMQACASYDGTQYELDTFATNASTAAIRTRLTTTTTFYVDKALGTDAAGCGLATGAAACASVQYIVNIVSNNYDLNGQATTFQVADGTGYAPFNVSQPWVGASFNASQIPNVVIRGNTGSPGNVVVDGGGATSCIGATNYGTVQVLGFTVQHCANTLLAFQYGSLYFDYVYFNAPSAVSGASNIFVSQFGRVEPVGGHSFIFAVGDYFLQSSHQGNFRATQINTGNTVFTLGSNLSPIIAMAYASSNGDITFTQYSSTAFNLNSFSVNGTAWRADSGGVIQVSNAGNGLSLTPTMFPGNTAGYCSGWCSVDQVNHNGPTVSSCGSTSGGGPSITGSASDFYGIVLEGASATGCNVLFHSEFSTAPTCQVSWFNGQPPGLVQIASNTTRLSITHGSATNINFSYHCEGS